MLIRFLLDIIRQILNRHDTKVGYATIDNWISACNTCKRMLDGFIDKKSVHTIFLEAISLIFLQYKKKLSIYGVNHMLFIIDEFTLQYSRSYQEKYKAYLNSGD